MIFKRTKMASISFSPISLDGCQYREGASQNSGYDVDPLPVVAPPEDDEDDEELKDRREDFLRVWNSSKWEAISAGAAG